MPMNSAQLAAQVDCARQKAQRSMRPHQSHAGTTGAISDTASERRSTLTRVSYLRHSVGDAMEERVWPAKCKRHC